MSEGQQMMGMLGAQQMLGMSGAQQVVGMSGVQQVMGSGMSGAQQMVGDVRSSADGGGFSISTARSDACYPAANF